MPISRVCVCVCVFCINNKRKTTIKRGVICSHIQCVCLLSLIGDSSVALRPVSCAPPVCRRGWLGWASTHRVHGLDHPGGRGGIGRLLLQAVGLLVDRLHLDVWFTEGDTSPTWEGNGTHSPHGRNAWGKNRSNNCTLDSKLERFAFATVVQDPAGEIWLVFFFIGQC